MVVLNIVLEYLACMTYKYNLYSFVYQMPWSSFEDGEAPGSISWVCSLIIPFSTWQGAISCSSLHTKAHNLLTPELQQVVFLFVALWQWINKIYSVSCFGGPGRALVISALSQQVIAWKSNTYSKNRQLINWIPASGNQPFWPTLIEQHSPFSVSASWCQTFANFDAKLKQWGNSPTPLWFNFDQTFVLFKHPHWQPLSLYCTALFHWCLPDFCFHASKQNPPTSPQQQYTLLFYSLILIK